MPSDLLFFDCTLELTAGSRANLTKKIKGIAYSGEPMIIAGQETIVEFSGLSIPDVLPIIVDHRAELPGIIGQAKAVISNGKLLFQGFILEITEAARQVAELLANGFPFQVSIGALPKQRKFIRPGESVITNGKTFEAGPMGLLLVTSAELKELSILPLGADGKTEISLVAAAAFLKGKNMSTENQSDFIVTSEQEKMLHANFHSATIDPAIEQKRMQLIDCWYPRFDPKISPDLCGKANMLKARATAGEISLEQYRMEAVDLIRAERPQAPIIHGSTRDVTPEIVQACLCKNAGLPNIEKHFDTRILEATDRAGNLGIQELLLKAAMDNGYTGRQRITDGNYREVMQHAMIRASGFSTHSIVNLLSNSAGKFAVDGYQMYPSRARPIAAVLSADNFKTRTGYRMTADIKYEEVPPAGEIHHGKFCEDTIFSYMIKTFAKMLALTRQDIINDDLGVFNSLRDIFGRGAAQTLENDFWKMILGNANSFFGEENNNVIDDVLSIAGISAAVTKFRQLTDSNGDPILATPFYLGVPPELEETSNRLYTSPAVLVDTDDEIPNGNPHQNKYLPLIVPHLSNANYTGNSTTAWYLFANDVKAAGIAYLNGIAVPNIEVSDTDFNTLGIQIRGVFDYAVCLIDPNGAIKSTGSPG
jgi:phage major head subunit gpT-like protein